MLAAIVVSYQTEVLSTALWVELMPLLRAHAHEVAHYPDLPLDPDMETYAKIEATNGLRVYTARHEGALVGYLAFFVHRSLHYSGSVFAHSDVLYVDPAHRGTRTGVALIRYAHEQLKAEGVTVCFQHVKHTGALNIGPMLQRFFGYEHVDDLLAIRLDRES